jgi:heme exporter protein A
VAAFRGERLVFSDLTFAIAPGGAMLLAGPNGAGKSTLLRLLAGLLRPAAGRVTWHDQDGDLPVAYLGHQDAIKLGLTVTENLSFAHKLHGKPTGAALEAFSLRTLAELPARLLSAGQRRRLALARLSLSVAPIWLLDEPTLGLDDASVVGLGKVLAKHCADGGVIIAATHLPLPLPDAATLRLAGE